MGTVSLIQSGLIYEDQFLVPELDSRWEISGDTSRFTHLEAGGLRLAHGDSPARLFFTPLTDIKKFVIDLQNTYNPASAGDVGGLIVYSDETEYIAMEEYFDAGEGVSMAYPWIRLIRDYNTYSAYWSEDGETWTIEGTTGFDVTVPKIGMFLEGVSGVPLDAQLIRICSGSDVIVGNVVPGTIVSLRDENNITVTSRVCRTGLTEVHLDMASLPVPFSGNFHFELPNGATYGSTELLTIWAGDKYDFGPSADLYYIDVEGIEKSLQANVEEFLGLINAGSLTYRNIKMIARNNMTTGSLTGVKADLAQYNDTDQYVRLTDLAPDAGGAPGTWADTVMIGDLAAGASCDFWLQVRRETDANLTEGNREAYFGITVTSTYTS